MYRSIHDRQDVANRAGVGAGILAAHVGLVALLATTGVIKTPTLVPSVAVTFLQQDDRPLERPDFDKPVLTPINQVLVPPPEVVVQIEPTSAAIAATAVQTPPSPTPTVGAPTSGTAVPEMSDVAYLVQPAPRYPPESRRIREQGLVILRVLIDEDGHAKAVEVYRSSGHPRLDEAARRAVERAVFKPYMDGGVPREAAAMVPVEFSLRSSAS
ncbi:MAG: energy transducer TonB [Steroidobacteraceae bacterium]